MDRDRAPLARPAGIAAGRACPSRQECGPRSPRAGADDELPPDLARLRNEIACGLYAQLPIRNETIEQEDVAGVAYALVIRLVQSFRFECVRPADERGDEEWSLDAATFRFSNLETD